MEMTIAQTTISLSREGQTIYAFSDAGEMVGSSSGENSLYLEVLAYFRSKGVKEIRYNGFMVDVETGRRWNDR